MTTINPGELSRVMGGARSGELGDPGNTKDNGTIAPYTGYIRGKQLEHMIIEPKPDGKPDNYQGGPGTDHRQTDV